MTRARNARALTIASWCTAAAPFVLAALMRGGFVSFPDDITGFKGVGFLLYFTIAVCAGGVVAAAAAIALARRAGWALVAALVHVTLLVLVALLVAGRL